MILFPQTSSLLLNSDQSVSFTVETDADFIKQGSVSGGIDINVLDKRSAPGGYLRRVTVVNSSGLTATVIIKLKESTTTVLFAAVLTDGEMIVYDGSWQVFTINGILKTSGANWLTGAGAPADGLGQPDDLYLDTATADYYKKTDESIWTLQGSLAGPAGVDAVAPTGAMLMFAGAEAPSGWLICDGSVLLISSYPDLFDAIGNVHGGDGITTFAVPDTRGRTPIGVGTGVGLSARALGDKVGNETHQLTSAEIPIHSHTGPSHTHDMGVHNHSVPEHTHDAAVTVTVNAVDTDTFDHSHADGGNSAAAWEPKPGNAVGSFNPSVDASLTGVGLETDSVDLGATSAAGTGSTGSAGGGGTHNNMQPSIAVNFIIKT